MLKTQIIKTDVRLESKFPTFSSRAEEGGEKFNRVKFNRASFNQESFNPKTLSEGIRLIRKRELAASPLKTAAAFLTIALIFIGLFWLLPGIFG